MIHKNTTNNMSKNGLIFVLLTSLLHDESSGPRVKHGEGYNKMFLQLSFPSLKERTKRGIKNAISKNEPILL